MELRQQFCEETGKIKMVIDQDPLQEYIEWLENKLSNPSPELQSGENLWKAWKSTAYVSNKAKILELLIDGVIKDNPNLKTSEERNTNKISLRINEKNGFPEDIKYLFNLGVQIYQFIEHYENGFIEKDELYHSLRKANKALNPSLHSPQLSKGISSKDLLQECKLQLEYLNEKFGETGTTNALISKLNQFNTEE